MRSFDQIPLEGLHKKTATYVHKVIQLIYYLSGFLVYSYNCPFYKMKTSEQSILILRSANLEVKFDIINNDQSTGYVLALQLNHIEFMFSLNQDA